MAKQARSSATTRSVVTLAAVAAVALLAWLGSSQGWWDAPSPAPTSSGAGASPSGSPADDGAAEIRELFEENMSNVEVHGTGTVTRILADDTEGSPHQKFVLTMSDGLTLLVAHNIDLAGRLDGLAVGDPVEFKGEYEWSEQGGTVHWTHHDPAGSHADGWLKWDGRTFA